MAPFVPLSHSRWGKIFTTTVIFLFVVLFYHRIASPRHVMNETPLDRNTFVPDKYGYLSLPEAEKLCKARKWEVYPERTKPRKIYDLFMINTELDWLEIRLHELSDEVDYFVIMESATTFTGLAKPLHLRENWAQFSAFHDKIIYHLLNDTSLSSDVAWDHEELQRNAMYDQVFPGLAGDQQPILGDVIIVSDIDEIPRPASLQVLRNCDYPQRLTLRSRFYYYSFQWRHHGTEWAHPQATTYRGPKNTIRPSALRYGKPDSDSEHYLQDMLQAEFDKDDLWNAAWHCSSCFATLAEMVSKISAFSHVEFDRAEFREPEGIVRRVRHGLDLFDRNGETYDRVDANKDVPKYLKKNGKLFGYMLDRDPPNANFRDYTAPAQDA